MAARQLSIVIVFRYGNVGVLRAFSSMVTRPPLVVRAFANHKSQPIKSELRDSPCDAYSRACSTTTTRCWKCGAPRTDIFNEKRKLDGISDLGLRIDADHSSAFFCAEKTCQALQPLPTVDYFCLFGLPRIYSIDTVKLTQTYRRMQQKLHPDMVIGLSEGERIFSDDLSAQINKAYDVLLKPVSRAVYLLELNGITMGDSSSNTNIQLPAEFLMEIMELNEEIDALKDTHQLNTIFVDIKNKTDKLLEELRCAFFKNDFDRAQHLVAVIKYHTNMADKVKEKIYVQ